ncbi:hypothetical protein Tco_0352995 [Tanacetum coccineum]
MHVEESIAKPSKKVIMDAEDNTVNDDVVNDADQPQDDSVPKTNTTPNNNWFKQPPRPPTPDPEWNKVKSIDDTHEQTWFNDILSAEKYPLTFDKLIATPIDFSKFAMNRLKIDNLTKADLVGPVYELLKGTCQSYRCPFALNKPLPLKGYLDSKRKYTTSITKTKSARSQLNRFLKCDVYSLLKILSVVSVKVNKLHGYGYLEEIMVRRADRKLYKFKEGDFINLHLNDIDDMILFVVQHKLFHLDGDVIVDLVVALHMFTKSLIIKKRVEDVQLGVESYQKKLNIPKPQKDFPTISAKELYTPLFDPQGFIYKDLSNRKRLMQADELYKFSDGKVKSVHNSFHRKLLNFRLGYNKDMMRRKWSATDHRYSCIMVYLIDKKLLERRIIRNLERLVGARELEMDYRLMQRTV